MFAETDSAGTWLFSGRDPRPAAPRWRLAVAWSLALLAGTATAPAPQRTALATFLPPTGAVCELRASDRETPASLLSSAVERQAILEIVRAHRRRASDRWHRRLVRAIHQESQAARIDPLMVAAIVAKESSFKSRIVSRSGAIGLMQLRPFVARDLARRSEIAWRGPATLHEPELNVRLGILYYKELMELFEGDPGKALTAYNYGPTRVSRQLRDGTFSGSGYAQSILELYDSLDRRRAALGHSLAGSSS
jgi:soluble lytic murein transglycosylase-like protein